MQAAKQHHWHKLCKRGDLVANSGVCARFGQEQVALFYVPGATTNDDALYALSNRDPIGKANVMSRGLLGDIGGALVVASPLYKEHYKLATGECLEDDSFRLQVYPVRLEGDEVLIGGC